MGAPPASARPGPLGPAFQPAIDAARTGDGRGCAALFHAFARPVAAYVANQGARDHEAVTSECFVRAFRSLERFAGDEERFRAWLFTIAHNLVIDDRRAAARRPTALSLDVDEAPCPAAPSADADALDRLATARVEALLRTLAPDQRDVLLLRLVAGLTCEQVAEALGKTLGAVKQLQRRGLDALRRQLAREGVAI